MQKSELTAKNPARPTGTKYHRIRKIRRRKDRIMAGQNHQTRMACPVLILSRHDSVFLGAVCGCFCGRTSTAGFHLPSLTFVCSVAFSKKSVFIRNATLSIKFCTACANLLCARKNNRQPQPKKTESWRDRIITGHTILV